MATFHVTNFGCRATQADGAAIERQFQEQGWERAAGPAEAEVVVLNTCTVTAAADQDARAAIRRIHRHSPRRASWSPAATRNALRKKLPPCPAWLQ